MNACNCRMSQHLQVAIVLEIKSTTKEMHHNVATKEAHHNLYAPWDLFSINIEHLRCMKMRSDSLSKYL